MSKKRKRQLYTFLKIGVTIFLLYFVFTKIPGKEVGEVFRNANKGLLLLALGCFIASQALSAERLLLLFRSVGFLISAKSNYMLYLIGMFYNFFIPGGVGGDAYKVFVLNKEFGWSLKKLTAAVFMDRFIGLTAIGVLIVILSFFIPLREQLPWLPWLLPLLLVVGVGTSYFFVKKWFTSFVKVFTKTLFQSLLVQLLQCFSIIILLASITGTDQYVLFLLVFLISSVLSIFSFSGIGVREIIFFQAATLFSFDVTVAVTIGLLFSSITGLVSLVGVVFHFKKTNAFIRKAQYSS